MQELGWGDLTGSVPSRRVTHESTTLTRVQRTHQDLVISLDSKGEICQCLCVYKVMV